MTVPAAMEMPFALSAGPPLCPYGIYCLLQVLKCEPRLLLKRSIQATRLPQPLRENTLNRYLQYRCPMRERTVVRIFITR